MKTLFNIVGILLQVAWVLSFLYGAYAALQAWNHRLPQRTRHQSFFPIEDQLDPKGRRWLKTALRAWAVAVGVILLAAIVF